MILPDNAKAFAKPFEFFTEISRIPRGSHNCRGIADYLCDFAKARGLSFVRDDACNVLIRKPASPGYEDHPAVILQGHTDMVAVKRDGVAKDMKKEGLDLKIDGDFLYAEGTSLGADDGVAVAIMLAVLDDDKLSHPKIEALFTADEEVGLLGATAFDASELTGRILFNLDSEEEGIFTVGCAGGIRCDAAIPLARAGGEKAGFEVTLSGLLGGHSGMEIGKGRANAIVELAAALRKIPGVRLVSFDGGDADNAIPSAATAVIVCPEDPGKILENALDLLTNVYKSVENGMKFEVKPAALSLAPMDAECSRRVLSFIAEAPHGVRAMSADIEGLVESSENPGIAKTDEKYFYMTTSVRSSLGEKKVALRDELEALAKAAGGSFSTRGDYPAWEFRKDSPFRDLLCRVYEESAGRAPACVVIHAGLECGILSEKIPGMDAVALGPDIFDIHTPDEKLSLPSAARTYSFILDALPAM